MKDFRYWLRLPCPNTMLDEEYLAQISKNLGHFLHFLNFWHQKRIFCSMHHATWRSLLIGASK